MPFLPSAWGYERARSMVPLAAADASDDLLTIAVDHEVHHSI